MRSARRMARLDDYKRLNPYIVACSLNTAVSSRNSRMNEGTSKKMYISCSSLRKLLIIIIIDYH